jgi:hypothetical protein
LPSPRLEEKSWRAVFYLLGVKRLILSIAALIATGCAASSSAPTSNKPIAQTPERHYAPAASSALAFTPPVAPDYPLLGLDRSARQAGAFIGYSDGTAESYSLGIVDHLSDDPTQTTYDRWSVSEKVGTRYR